MKRRKYVKIIRNRILVLLALLVIVCVSFSTSYSNFVYNSTDHRAVEMYVSPLNYEIKINDTYNGTIAVKPGNSFVNIDILSNNGVSTKYKLMYGTDDNLSVYFLDNVPSGDIGSGKSKTHRLIVSNLSDNIIKVNFKIVGGYNTNKLEDIIAPLGFSEINQTIHIGDYVEYKPVNANDSYEIDKEISGYTKNQTVYKKNSKWRVFDINDDGSIDIISEKSISIDSKYNLLHLSGYKGYNNGVYILNDVCNRLYGSYFATARNISINDIESKLSGNWNPKEYINSIAEDGYKQYDKNMYVPAIYSEGLDRSDSFNIILQDEYTVEDSLETEINYWTHDMEEDNFKDLYYDIIMNQKYNTWISSRYVNAFDSYALFGISNMEKNTIMGNILYSSINDTFTGANAIRPIVNIKTGIQLENGVFKIKN